VVVKGVCEELEELFVGHRSVLQALLGAMTGVIGDGVDLAEINLTYSDVLLAEEDVRHRVFLYSLLMRREKS
jgi:hypothetical protein